jgi:hypothetical protein
VTVSKWLQEFPDDALPILDSLVRDESLRVFEITFVPEAWLSSSEKEHSSIAFDDPAEGKEVARYLAWLGNTTGWPIARISHLGGNEYTVSGTGDQLLEVTFDEVGSAEVGRISSMINCIAKSAQVAFRVSKSQLRRSA